MLGLAEALKSSVNTVFALFSEEGLNRSFSDEIERAGFSAIGLRHDTPHLISARREIIQLVAQEGIDVLVCHGYKASTVGWFAARKCGIPVVAVSRGWTRENWKVGAYERLDRFMLRRMDRVICVSAAQAERVKSIGVRPDRTIVIRNSVSVQRFGSPDPVARARLIEYFPKKAVHQIRFIVGSAGRLSPEKGFDVLVNAAQRLAQKSDKVGFVLFGEGSQRDYLQKKIEACGVGDRMVMPGFCEDLDFIMPNLDLFVQSSNTEGLPNVILESMAAGVPVVATDVGGTAEVLCNGRYGSLVPPGDATVLADKIDFSLQNSQRTRTTEDAKRWVQREFSFEAQAAAYTRVFDCLLNPLTTCPD